MKRNPAKRTMRIKKNSNEQEIIDLRLKSAIGGLNQMRLDIARMDSRTIPSDTADLDILKTQVREISDYIHDLEKGFEELEDY